MQNLLDDLERWFHWIPEWVAGLALIAFAVIAALALHRVLIALARHLISSRRSLFLTVIERTQDPGRIAFCLAATALVLPLAPLDDRWRLGLTKLMVITCIAVSAWIATRAVDMAAARYLLRFRLDVEDNLLARKHITQVRVFKRITDTLIVIIAAATALTSFDSVRQYGVSLFASAGAAGIIVGLAARPFLTNIIAGVQIAVTQPIRIDDAVIVENEWGWVEEIASTYVVVRLWDWRRMVVPLSYFIEKPFQNWTREGAAIIGSVTLHVDYTAEIGRIRSKLEEIVRQSKLWDGEVVNLQVTDTTERTIELRALVSARNAPRAWDLRCDVREKLIAFLQAEMPEALPKSRADLHLEPTLQEQIPLAGDGSAAGKRSRVRERA